MPRLEKGSAAAKERMSHLRSLRKKKVVGEGGCSSSTYDKSTTLDQKAEKSGKNFSYSLDDKPVVTDLFTTENPAARNTSSSKTKITKTKTKGTGMKSPWIKWVADYAHKNNMNYFEALKDPNVKKGYHSQK